MGYTSWAVNNFLLHTLLKSPAESMSSSHSETEPQLTCAHALAQESHHGLRRDGRRTGGQLFLCQLYACLNGRDNCTWASCVHTCKKSEWETWSRGSEVSLEGAQALVIPRADARLLTWRPAWEATSSVRFSPYHIMTENDLNNFGCQHSTVKEFGLVQSQQTS